MIYKVEYADGTSCCTGYRPLALVWAKRKGSRLIEVNDMATPEETRSFETVKRLHATSPEAMQLDATISAIAIAWGWLWHVTTEDDRVKTARHLLGQFLNQDMKRYGIQTAKDEGAQVNVHEIEAAMLRGEFGDA
jgi:hypothetical protein